MTTIHYSVVKMLKLLINETIKDINKFILLTEEIDKDLYTNLGYTLSHTCYLYNVDVIKLLCDNYNIPEDIKLRTIKYVLRNYKLNLHDDGNPIYKNACESILKLLLENFDPSLNDSIILDYACQSGNVELVKSLLQDNRINPLAQECKAFINSCGLGNLEIVKLFLTDPHIDPSCYKNSAIRMAYSSFQIDKKHIDPLTIVGLLINRKEVYESLSEDEIKTYSKLLGG